MDKEERQKIRRRASLLNDLERIERALESTKNSRLLCPPYGVILVYSENELGRLPLTPLLKEYFIEEFQKKVDQLTEELKKVE